MKIDENIVNVTRKSSFQSNNNRMIKSEITRKFDHDENDENSDGNSGKHLRSTADLSEQKQQRRRRLNDYDLIDFDRSCVPAGVGSDEMITSSSSVRKKDMLSSSAAGKLVPRREQSLMALSSVANQSASLSSSSTAGFADCSQLDISYQCTPPDINQVKI